MKNLIKFLRRFGLLIHLILIASTLISQNSVTAIGKKDQIESEEIMEKIIQPKTDMKILPFNDDYVKKEWQMINLGSYIGSAGIISKDLDNDGIDELILSGSSGAHLHLMKYKNENYYDFWCSGYFSESIRKIDVKDIDLNATFEVYVMFGNGSLLCYESPNMTLKFSHNFNISSVNDFQISDVDNDLNMEIVIAGSEKISVFNLTNFVLEWETSSYGSYDIEISDVDDDGNQEIVLCEGKILDGLTHQLDWQYTSNFGFQISLNDIDDDTIDEIIGLAYNYVIAFDGLNYSILWQFNTNDGNDCFSVEDIDDDGIEEIITGADQWGDISCYNSSTQQLLWVVANPEWGVINVAIGDTDGDEINEVIWGAGQTLFVASTEYYQIEWSSLNMDGPFFVDVSDLEPNDIQDIIITSIEDLLIYDGEEHLLLNFLENLSGWDNINIVKSKNINDTPQSEIIIGLNHNYYSIIVYDGSTFELLFSSNQFTGINAIEILDIDNDGIIEIILGSSYGKVYILNGQTFEIEWQSINTGSAIGLIRVDDCDNDNENEIIFNGQNNILQVYNAVTHLLEWQSINVSGITAFDVADINRDGKKEFIISNDNGTMVLIDCETHTIIGQQSVSNSSISYLEAANVDTSAYERILIATSKLTMLDGLDFSVLWESEQLCEPNNPNYIAKQIIKVCDIDFDQYMDIFIGNAYGVIQFECNIPYPDITPPKVKNYSPSEGFSNASLNVNIHAVFSEEIDSLSANIDNISIKDSDNNEIEFGINLSYINDQSELLLTPLNLLPPQQGIIVTLKGLITDTSNNGLDGNGNGIAEGSPIDDFSWTFFSGSGIDTISPVVTFVEMNPDTVWKGTNVGLQAAFSDSSTYAMSPIMSAEMFIDEPGINGEGILIAASDGCYDEVFEEISLVIETTNFSYGTHSIYLHAKDLCGNWGDYTELNLFVMAEMENNWSMYGNNAQHTSYNPYDTAIYQMTPKWSKNLSDIQLLEPIIINNRVYISKAGSFYADGGVYCINLLNGNIDWEKPFTNPYTITSPSFAYGRVYLQVGMDSDNGTSVFSLDAISGETIWSSPFDSQWQDYLPPTIYGNKVLINGGYYGGAYAFHAQTGQQIWFHQLLQCDRWTPAAYKNVVYAFTTDSDYSILTAININSGLTIWEKSLLDYYSSLNTAPVVDTNAKIIFVTSENYIHAINFENQEVLWYKSGNIGITPTIGSDNVYVIMNGQLVAYDKFTGIQQWSFQGLSDISFPPVLTSDHIIVSSDAKTMIISLEDHQVVWEYNHGGKVSIGCGFLLIASTNGTLYCFERDLSTSIESKEIFTNNKITLYPNPAHDNLNVEFEIEQNCDVGFRITDIMGNNLISDRTSILMPGNYHHQINVSQLNKGVYFLYLKKLGKVIVKKFIVQ